MRVLRKVFFTSGIKAKIKYLCLGIQQTSRAQKKAIAQSMAKAFIFLINKIAAFFEKLFHVYPPV